MNIRYKGETKIGILYKECIYETSFMPGDYYCIKDDSNNDNFYEKRLFEIIEETIMKVKFIGKSSFSLINGNIYEVIGIENDANEKRYRVIDETKEDYLFDSKYFEII